MLALIDVAKDKLNEIAKKATIIETFEIETIEKNSDEYKLYLDYKNKKNKKFYNLDEIKKIFQ